MSKEKNNDEKSSSWKNMLTGVISAITQQASNAILELTKHSLAEIKEEKEKIFTSVKQKFAALILLATGAIFLCVAIALLINEIFTTRNSIGYLLVGLVLLVVGLAITKKK